MNVGSHIAELEEKHQRLEQEIQEELLHPGSDDLHIAELKRAKLRLKDRIEQLRFTPTQH